MFFQHIRTGDITKQHLDLLMLVWADVPVFQVQTRLDVLNGLFSGRTKLYEIKKIEHKTQLDGVLLVSVLRSNGENRLMVEGITYTGAVWRLSALNKALIALAEAHDCAKVETTVYDKRLAAAMLRTETKQESVTLILETGNGQ